MLIEDVFCFFTYIKRSVCLYIHTDLACILYCIKYACMYVCMCAPVGVMSSLRIATYISAGVCVPVLRCACACAYACVCRVLGSERAAVSRAASALCQPRPPGREDKGASPRPPGWLLERSRRWHRRRETHRSSKPRAGCCGRWVLRAARQAPGSPRLASLCVNSC